MAVNLSTDNAGKAKADLIEEIDEQGRWKPRDSRSRADPEGFPSGERDQFRVDVRG